MFHPSIENGILLRNKIYITILKLFFVFSLIFVFACQQKEAIANNVTTTKSVIANVWDMANNDPCKLLHGASYFSWFFQALPYLRFWSNIELQNFCTSRTFFFQKICVSASGALCKASKDCKSQIVKLTSQVPRQWWFASRY